MKKLITLVCAVLLLGVGSHSSSNAEDNVVYGKLTIENDPCEVLPVLQGTSWAGTINIVSETGFHFGETITLSITEQEQHLFRGVITSLSYYKDFQPCPFFGAFLSCYEIRISTGQSVLFATLDTSGTVMTGYNFSTDPLLSGEPQPDPNMSTFQLTMQK